MKNIRKEVTMLMLTCILFYSESILAQNEYKVGFTGGPFKVNKDISKNKNVEIPLKYSLPDTDTLKKYKVIIEVKPETNITDQEYRFNTKEINLNDLKKNNSFFLIVKKDNLPDRERKILIELKIVNIKSNELIIENKADTTKTFITVESSPSLKGYDYLAYIGTNFDLIDGIKTKNLFFATNFFRHPKYNTKGFGFNFAIIGNRAMTSIDKSSSKEAIITKHSEVDQDRIRIYKGEGFRETTRTTDNLGASFSPLIPLWGLSDDDKIMQIYWAPQMEIIWRRSIASTTYSDIVVTDTTKIIPKVETIRTINRITPTVSSSPFNTYDIYMTLLGVYISHENEDISIRIQPALGINVSYTSNNYRQNYNPTNTPNYIYEQYFDKSWKWYFSTRAWITEPKSGITLGLEVLSNFSKNNPKPYYNVTLSKAISFANLGSIFSPLTSR